MYNADDAVARVDSYIVSVSGAGRFVASASWCGSRRSRGPPRSPRCSAARAERRREPGDGEGATPS